MNWGPYHGPLDPSSMDPVDRARAALHFVMPATYGAVELAVAKAIREAELSRETIPEIGT